MANSTNTGYFFGPGIGTSLQTIPHPASYKADASELNATNDPNLINTVADIPTTQVDGTTAALATPTTTTPTPATSDIVDKIKYTVPPSAVELDGYILRDNTAGTTQITDVNLNPVAGAALVTPDDIKDDVLRPVTYTIPPATTEQSGYQMRRADDDTLYVADSSFAEVAGAVIKASAVPPVERDYDATLTSPTTTFNLPNVPAAGTEPLIQIDYNGHGLNYGTGFTVVGSTIDIAPAGLSWVGDITLDVKYWTDA